MGAALLTFHRAVSKPLLLLTQKRKVGVIQPALTFLCWSFLPGAQHCLASLTIKWALLVPGTCPGSLSISTAASTCRNVPRCLQRSMILCWWGERGQKRSSIPSPCLSSDSFTRYLGENSFVWLEEKGESLYFPRGLGKIHNPS